MSWGRTLAEGANVLGRPWPNVIDLSISDEAEIHFEELQLGKTNQIKEFRLDSRSAAIYIAMLLVSSLMLKRLTKT
jgi:hypothetical protein